MKRFIAITVGIIGALITLVFSAITLIYGYKLLIIFGFPGKLLFISILLILFGIWLQKVAKVIVEW